MINYSTCMRGNPTDKDAAKKAYANAQYSQVMTLDKFCYHIANYNKNQSCIIYTFYPVLKHKSFIRLHHALNHWCHIIIFILC